MNGINEILEIMRAFGLLGTYSNLLVLGTSSCEPSKMLYRYLKEKGYNVHNRPDDNYYDFIFTPLSFYGVTGLEHLLTKLRQGGIILVQTDDDLHISVNGKYLQINKSYGILKG